MERLNTKKHVVYYICSPWTKHAYVGQTKDEKTWAGRIQTEIRTAKNIFYERKKKKFGEVRKVDRMMGVMGFYNWIAIPVVLLPNTTELTYRLKVEEDIRRRLQPTMNTTERFRRGGKVTVGKKRPARWKRKGNKETYKNMLKRGTKFLVYEEGWKPVLSLDSYLSHTDATKIVVKTNPMAASFDSTDYKALEDKFAQSLVKVKGIVGKTILKNFIDNGLRNNKPKYFVISRKVNLDTWRNQKEKIIRGLINHRDAGRRQLRRYCLEKLFDIVATVDGIIQKPIVRRRVKNNLKKYIDQITRSYPTNFTMQFIYDHRIPQKDLGFIGKKIIQAAEFDTSVKNFIIKETRVIAKKRTSIKAILVNNKTITDNWTNVTTPKCMGGVW